MVRPLLAGATRLNLALDDTSTKRYGPHVQGAGIHHNPTPGPAGSPYVYGHVFVVLGLLVTHQAWGTIALPLLSRLYVRKKDLPAIDPKHRPEFRTKLELAVELLRWAKPWLDLLRLPIWVVADGAYAKKEFLKPAAALGMTVVSRLRKDAALRSLPEPKPPGRRGPAPTYGQDVIDLAKRAGQRRGWSSDTFELYGEKVAKRYKTFLATSRPAGGVFRVVLEAGPGRSNLVVDAKDRSLGHLALDPFPAPRHRRVAFRRRSPPTRPIASYVRGRGMSGQPRPPTSSGSRP